MATVLADTYYLKALENYYWEPSDALENLGYALSYDSDHAPSNCLMGVLHMEKLKDYSAAEYYLQQAIAADADYACAYENLVRLYLITKRYCKAERVLIHANKIATVDRAKILRGMALVLEARGYLNLAKQNLKMALVEILTENDQNLIQKDLDRIKSKTRLQKKKK